MVGSRRRYLSLSNATQCRNDEEVEATKARHPNQVKFSSTKKMLTLVLHEVTVPSVFPEYCITVFYDFEMFNQTQPNDAGREVAPRLSYSGLLEVTLFSNQTKLNGAAWWSLMNIVKFFINISNY